MFCSTFSTYVKASLLLGKVHQYRRRLELGETFSEEYQSLLADLLAFQLATEVLHDDLAQNSGFLGEFSSYSCLTSANSCNACRGHRLNSKHLHDLPWLTQTATVRINLENIKWRYRSPLALVTP